MQQSDRAVTPVISTILMVALVVLLTATVSVFFLGVIEDRNEPAPNVADTTGEFELEKSDPFTLDNQLVRITHLGGDNVPVEEIEIIVRASGPGSELPTEARLVNLPADGENIDGKNIEGNENLISENGGSFGNPADQIIINSDSNTWNAGDTIQFRIASGGADFRDEESRTGPEADELEVIIVHTPSNAILSEHTFTP